MIPYSRQSISKKDISSVTKVLKSNFLTKGPLVKEFEKKIKHKNFIFSNGIDLIYEFFNLESKFNNSILTKSVNLLGKNNSINNFFTKLADKGIVT